MNCPTCGRPHEACLCTAAYEWLDEIGIGREMPLNEKRVRNSTLFVVTCNVLALAFVSAVAVGVKFVWALIATK